RSRGPTAIKPTFEAPFVRLEYVGNRRFNLAYMRHTDKWWEVYQGRGFSPTRELCGLTRRLPGKFCPTDTKRLVRHPPLEAAPKPHLPRVPTTRRRDGSPGTAKPYAEKRKNGSLRPARLCLRSCGSIGPCPPGFPALRTRYGVLSFWQVAAERSCEISYATYTLPLP